MKKVIKLIRNLRIIFWIFKHRFDFCDETSLRKLVKEARHELGYDDIGEWF